jgi:hypothetical protein
LKSLPDEVERFLREHIGSVDELEILLLVRDHPGRAWTGDTVARELRLDPAVSHERLTDLGRRGFVVAESLGTVTYAARPEFEHPLSVLDDLYRRFRSAVIGAIVSNPSLKVESFLTASKPPRGPR